MDVRLLKKYRRYVNTHVGITELNKLTSHTAIIGSLYDNPICEYNGTLEDLARIVMAHRRWCILELVRREREKRLHRIIRKRYNHIIRKIEP